jgi:hypothetical protein
VFRPHWNGPVPLYQGRTVRRLWVALSGRCIARCGVSFRCGLRGAPAQRHLPRRSRQPVLVQRRQGRQLRPEGLRRLSAPLQRGRRRRESPTQQDAPACPEQPAEQQPQGSDQARRWGLRPVTGSHGCLRGATREGGRWLGVTPADPGVDGLSPSRSRLRSMSARVTSSTRTTLTPSGPDTHRGRWRQYPHRPHRHPPSGVPCGAHRDSSPASSAVMWSGSMLKCSLCSTVHTAIAEAVHTIRFAMDPQHMHHSASKQWAVLSRSPSGGGSVAWGLPRWSGWLD